MIHQMLTDCNGPLSRLDAPTSTPPGGRDAPKKGAPPARPAPPRRWRGRRQPTTDNRAAPTRGGDPRPGTDPGAERPRHGKETRRLGPGRKEGAGPPGRGERSKGARQRPRSKRTPTGRTTDGARRSAPGRGGDAGRRPRARRGWRGGARAANPPPTPAATPA